MQITSTKGSKRSKESSRVFNSEGDDVRTNLFWVGREEKRSLPGGDASEELWGRPVPVGLRVGERRMSSLAGGIRHKQLRQVGFSGFLVLLRWFPSWLTGENETKRSCWRGSGTCEHTLPRQRSREAQQWGSITMKACSWEANGDNEERNNERMRWNIHIRRGERKQR